ncbi:MAG TPA: leucine-rich repeat domain-containing protein [Porticoccaceae bacterium]
MKKSRLLTLLTLSAAVLTLSGCNRYQFTLNEQVLHTPPQLFAGYQLQDPGLHSCTAQTIVDRSITRADQLVMLNCSNGEITTTNGLEIFNQLQTLNLSNNRLVDIKALLILPHLTSVNLANNPELDCQTVAKLEQQVKGQFIPPAQCE